MSIELRKKLDLLLNECNQKVIGKQEQVLILSCCLLSGSHILIEDVPGMGKTTLAKTMAILSGLDFNRIQFTSDLLPSDILGFRFLDTINKEFKIQKGPIFTNILLADEINRASPKSQSAFLQAMEERNITIEGETFELDDNFMVLATQNPKEQVGTHSLPESQLDRFSVSMTMGKNSRDIEREILLGRGKFGAENLSSCLTTQEVRELKKQCESIEIAPIVLDYTLDLIEFIRDKFKCHISIRAPKDILALARVRAFIMDRSFVIPDDISFFTPYALAHRIGLSHDIEYSIGKVKSAIQEIEVPVL